MPTAPESELYKNGKGNESLRRWMERKHGLVNYYLTHLLYGHDYFCKYLFKMGKMT